MEPYREDLTFWIGQTYKKTWTFFYDPRLTEMRGDWKRYSVYEQGTGVTHLGSAYVSLIENDDTPPGGASLTEFWAPLARLNLTGYTVSFIVDGVFTIEPTAVAAKGEASVEVPPTRFAAPPSSARYRLMVTDPTGAVSFPRLGTAIFKKP
jgi:hypothetical protein